MDEGALWSVWWIWLCIAISLGALEIFVSGFIFLGFAIAAFLVSLILLGFGSLFSLPVLILLFAVLSLAAWLMLRSLFVARHGQVRKFDHDIND